MSRNCGAENCERPAIARGLCDKHYRRWKSHGDPNVRLDPAKALLRKPRLKFLVEHSIARTDDCILWPFSVWSNGYGHYSDELGCTSAHRKMCLMVYGEPPDPLMDAAHSCRNRHCVNPRHLSWKTKSENAADRVADGTMIFGRSNPNAKLCEREVIEIRRMAAKGHTHTYIAKQFGVERGAVSKILRGERWRWLDQHAKHFVEAKA